MSKVSKFFKKVFDPKSGLYSVLLGLMSFLAILISLLTLQEMKAQRELSMMPIIRLQDFNNKQIHVDSSCVEMIYGDQIKLDQNSKKQAYSENASMKDWFALSLINVGEGSAVNLEVDWDINFNWFLEHFKSLKIDPEIFKVKAMENSFFFTYKKCSDVGLGDSHSRQNISKKSHLLSASADREGVKIKIPQIILKLHIAAMKANWLVDGQNESNVANLSVEHEFTISYESVNGNKYTDKYKAELALTPPIVNTVLEKGKKMKVSASYEEFILELLIEKL